MASNHLKSALRTIEKFLEAHSILDYQIRIESGLGSTEVELYPRVSPTHNHVVYTFEENIF